MQIAVCVGDIRIILPAFLKRIEIIISARNPFPFPCIRIDKQELITGYTCTATRKQWLEYDPKTITPFNIVNILMLEPEIGHIVSALVSRYNSCATTGTGCPYVDHLR